MAAQQSKYGRLCDEVKKNALECINRRYTIDGWFNQSDSKKREKILNDLKEKITGEQIAPRKISKPKRVKAIWEEGDIVAYHLVNIVEDAYRKPSDFWFYGKYILLKIVKIKKNPVSKILPELVCDEWMYCSVYDWIGDVIPDISIIKSLNFHPLKYNDVRKEYDYVAIIYNTILNPSYKRKHDAAVIGNDKSGKYPPRLNAYSYNADVIEFTLSRMPKFTLKEIGYYNENGMP